MRCGVTSLEIIQFFCVSIFTWFYHLERGLFSYVKVFLSLYFVIIITLICFVWFRFDSAAGNVVIIQTIVILFFHSISIILVQSCRFSLVFCLYLFLFKCNFLSVMAGPEWVGWGGGGTWSSHYPIHSTSFDSNQFGNNIFN